MKPSDQSNITKPSQRDLSVPTTENTEAGSNITRVSRRKLREERDKKPLHGLTHLNDGRAGRKDKKGSAQHPLQRLQRAREDGSVYLHPLRYVLKNASKGRGASSNLRKQIAGNLASGPTSDTVQLFSSSIEGGVGKQTDQIFRHDVLFNSQSDKRSFVEKIIQPDYDRSILRPWAQEAIVYKKLSEEKEPFGLLVPSFYGMSVYRFNRISFFIDYLEGYHSPTSLEEWKRVAYALGEFGGWGSVKGRWKASWLPRGTELRLKPAQTLQAWEQFGGASPSFRDVHNNYRFLADNFNLAVQLYEQLPSTICHADPNPQNIFVSSGSPSVFLIDWERVSRGKIADDLVLIYLPQNLLLHGGMNLEEFLALEESMIASYTSGVLAHAKGVDGKEVVRIYSILNCVAMMRWLGRGVQMRESMQGLLKEFPERVETFQRYIAHQSHRAREALEAEKN